jgi:uncharacterized protein (TIGR03067 family)
MRLASIILILSAAAFLAADDSSKDDAASIKGKWSVVSWSHGGEALPADLIKAIKISFEDKKYSIIGEDPFNEEGEYAIDASKSPKTIDFDIKKGRDEGKKQLGIYKLEGDKLTIIAAGASATDRPSSFKIDAGADLVEVVLEKPKS